MPADWIEIGPGRWLTTDGGVIREECVSLAALFESKFRGDIRFRGQAYLDADRVAVTRVLPDHLFAVVRDGDEYQTQLTRHNGEMHMFCSCVGEGSTKEPACKHLWATLLAVDAGQHLSGYPSGGKIPEFISEISSSTSGSLLDDLDDDELGGGDVYEPVKTSTRTRSRKPTTVVAPPPKVMRDWETKLNDLRVRFTPNSAKARQVEQEREIFYEVDLQGSRAAGQLLVQTSQRQRRTNGQWGKLKPLKLRPDKLDDIESEDDRRILAYLVGGTPERSGWVAQQTEFQSATFRYLLPYELAGLLLPLMTSTQRMRIMGDAEGRFDPITWDDGAAWTLCLSVRQEADGDQWRVRGELRREGQSIDVRKADLLIAGGLVLKDHILSRLDDFGAFDWVSLVTDEKGLVATAGEEQSLVDQLLDMPALPELDLPDELKLEEVRVAPAPRLRIRSPRGKGWKYERLQGFVDFDYAGTSVPGSSQRWAIVQREQGRCLIRDRQAESACWSRLHELGFRRLLDNFKSERDVDIAVTELGRAARGLIADGWEVLADGREVRQAGAMRFQVRSHVDWFGLSGQVSFGDRSVSFPELLSAIARKDGTVRLDDGSLGLLPEEWLEKYGLLAGLGSAEGDEIRFSTTQAMLIDALLASQEDVDFDEPFRQLRERMQSFDGITPSKEPEGFKGELRSYQREGLGWLKFLEEFRFGGCLADDMGLGKTVQLLALLQEPQRARVQAPAVVDRRSQVADVQLGPRDRTVHSKLTWLEYSGTERHNLLEQFPKRDIIVTTYGTLRRDIDDLSKIELDYAVLDEAQTIKNAASQVSRASRLLKARHRLALSGTPIENHLSDLWSIFEFLNPSMLGRSTAFRQSIGSDEENESRKVLARGLKPFVLRRTKSQVATELPDRLEETIYCQMGKRQRKLYDELREHYRQSLLGAIKEDGMAKSKMHVLEALLRLRQVACHPGLLDEKEQHHLFAKLEFLCPQLQELIEEGHKSLVFSQFTSMLALVRQQLDERGIRYAYLDGKTRNRKEVVEEFQGDPECKVFLISLKAGGLGLNLTAAEYVFLLDPWWNPAVEAQAIDRAHRVGQTRQVFAYRLICRDTVEEKILELQKQKRELADAILEADNRMLKDLTAEDLEMLLS
ncbi:MAG: SNF2-related protein [Planctomycetaceae bacterium]